MHNFRLDNEPQPSTSKDPVIRLDEPQPSTSKDTGNTTCPNCHVMVEAEN